MREEDYRRERRKQRRLEALGTNDPACFACGVSDWRCLELHHVADHGCDDTMAIVCRNCHRALSDSQKDHPAFDPAADPLLHTLGRFLLGLADMISRIIEPLRNFAHALLTRAAASGEVL